MPYEKTILFLANSRKLSGRCIAGKEISEEGAGQWIRPVSKRPDKEISEEDRRYENGERAQVLDVVSINFKKSESYLHQTENHLIDDECYWCKIRTASWNEIETALDLDCGPLWVNGSSSYNGINDRVPEAKLKELDRSLFLIRPDNLKLSVQVEGGVFGPAKRRIRASFHHADVGYKLMVTDPVIERNYLGKENGTYQINNAILCVSLAEAWHGHAYKLVAAIITPDMGAEN